jgi:hypothetical protein
MWVRLDDNLPAHHKLAVAGQQIGRAATGRILAIFVEALCWTNKHNTDGFLPADVVPTFRHDRKPLVVAEAMVRARLWESTEGGWRIHDWGKYQLDAHTRETIAKARSEAGRKGAESRWKNGNHGKPHGKRMAKNAPVPVPFASKEAKSTVRARATALPPSSGGKPKHQPKTTGAWSCPHTPQCESYDACIARVLKVPK